MKKLARELHSCVRAFAIEWAGAALAADRNKYEMLIVTGVVSAQKGFKAVLPLASRAYGTAHNGLGVSRCKPRL